VAKSVRDVMSSECECVGEGDTLADAAKRLAELDVGAMPICGDDDKLKGMLTDRDIVVKAIAQGKDPSGTTAGDLAEGKPIVVGADASVEDALHKMTENKIRRLPVVDDDKRLCGMVSQADLATNIDEEKVGDLVEAISAAP
jgi:CBS domain-containing protein